MEEYLPPPLDSIQLRKIESIHRGFLYQHLYSVGCLLLAGSNCSTLVRVEGDEDIEVCFRDSVVYAQVKTRTSKLYMADIEETLARFELIRNLHERGERSGNPWLIIVSNVPLGGSLADNYAESGWPSDVVILIPGVFTKIPFKLPPAWETLPEAIAWCVEKAEVLPFRILSSQTLVWKLAALVQYACTGEGNQQHIFRTDLLHELLEQVVVHLQSFPVEPTIYREHLSEPVYTSNSQVRLIVGQSGSGKSVWASRLGAHCADPALYFDAALVDEPAVTSSLARELAAKLLKETGGGAYGMFLPGAGGFETLSALSSYASQRAFFPVVVIDNAHKITAEILVRIKDVGAGFKWVFICQPSPNQVKLATLLSLTPEYMQPWSLSSVAAEFENAGCSLTPENAQRVIDLTGGVPLFVRSVATVCKSEDGGNIEKTLQDIVGELSLTATAQEVITARAYESLSSQAKDGAAIMSFSPLSHSKEVLFKLISGLAGEQGRESAAVRDLLAAGIAQIGTEGEIFLHDAYRNISSRALSAMPEIKFKETMTRYREIYGPPWEVSNVKRIGPYLRSLAALGDYKSILDLCGAKGEFLFELGLSSVVRELLDNALHQTPNDEDLFYILDTLCFWYIQDRNEKEARPLLDEMGKILERGRLSEKEWGTFYLKRMALNGRENLEEGHKFYKAALAQAPDPLFTLILRYNYAVLLFKHKEFKQAARESFEIAMQYFDRLGLDPEDVIAKNPPEIFDRLKGKVYDTDDFKRLADSLDLYGRCCIEQRQSYGIARFHAFKFYTMAYAVRSAMKVGMDVVDDYLGLLGDAKGARKFIEESLLPTLSDFKVLEYFLPIRAQYAVVLAYCGDFIAARRELARLMPFRNSAPPEWIKEVENQSALIDAIEAGKVKLITPAREENTVPRVPVRVGRRIGRNERCPCGSGKKYKKCCGR